MYPSLYTAIKGDELTMMTKYFSKNFFLLIKNGVWMNFCMR